MKRQLETPIYNRPVKRHRQYIDVDNIHIEAPSLSDEIELNGRDNVYVTTYDNNVIEFTENDVKFFVASEKDNDSCYLDDVYNIFDKIRQTITNLFTF